MNLYFSSVVCTILQGVLLIISLFLLKRRILKKTTGVIAFLSSCLLFDLCVFCELNTVLISSTYLFLLLGFQALLPVLFIRLSLDKISKGIQPDSFKFLLGAYVLFFALIVASFSIFDGFLKFSNPDIYGLTFASLLTVISVLALMIKKRKWNQRNAFGILLLFMVLTVSFIYSAFQRADGVSLAIVNILFITMLVVLVKQEEKAEKIIPGKLTDYNLTNRQLEVARLILLGYSFGQIAKQLNIAESTASKHGSDIYAKTGCSDKTMFYQKFYASFEAVHAEHEHSMLEKR